MARPPLALFWQHKIADLMANSGMANKPGAIASVLVREEVLDDHGVNTAPQLRTIVRYMQRIRSGRFTLYEQCHYFRWPEDLGSGENQVPKTHSFFALECMGYYKEQFDITPMIGVLLRFGLVSSSVREDDLEYTVQKRAVIAEQLWYSDLVESISGFERPDTSSISLELARSAVSDARHTMQDTGEEEMNRYTGNFRVNQEFSIPLKDWKFLEYMPCFRRDIQNRIQRNVESTKKIRDGQRAISEVDRNRIKGDSEGKVERDTAWLQEDDFAWYTENILKKFPELSGEVGELVVFRPRPN